MNSVQMHLTLTHVPVILSIVGLVMFVAALLIKNDTLIKASYIIIAIAGVAVLPVSFTGEGAEEAVEHMPGVSEALIERHEGIAKFAMISIVAAGAVALTALFSFQKYLFSRVLKVMVLLLVITSSGLMAQTAHLGGQIRHTEIRNSTAMRNNDAAAGNKETQGGNNQQQDDD